MKTRERHRLKENDLAHSIAVAREYLEPRTTQVVGLAVVVVLAIAAIVGITVMRGRTDSQAEVLLGEAMVALNAPVVPITATGATPGEVPAAATLGAEGSFTTETAKLNAALPKLKAAADAYPDAAPGITARYHMAGALAALGRHEEAITAFDDVIQRAGDSLYGRMARMGRADTQAKAGQLDAAIASWKELASQTDGELPKDAILMELARAYAAQGNQEEARRTFTQLVDEHPTSPYSTEARAELETLKG
jgi:tetratricopeptide (TPR) repeat protein